MNDSLDSLSAAIGIGKKTLRGMAETGQIPALRINGRWYFDREQVRETLRGQAQAEADARRAQQQAPE
jgi:hypothetical protein